MDNRSAQPRPRTETQDTDPRRTVPRGRRKVIGYAVLFLVFLVIAELASFVGLRFLDKYLTDPYWQSTTRLLEDIQGNLSALFNTQPTYVRFDREQGWTIAANGYGRAGGVVYKANAAGFRAQREYPTERRGDLIRIAAFGDSFVHSDDVSNSEMWTQQLEALNGGLEVLNFGVGGYGTDQAYRRYLERGKRYAADIVIIGYMSDNLTRNVNVFTPFLRRHSFPLGKPRYLLRGDGSLQLLPQPFTRLDDIRQLLLSTPASKHHALPVLRELGKHDYWYGAWFDKTETARFHATELVCRVINVLSREFVTTEDGIYNVASEPYRVTMAIIQVFYQDVLSAGAHPVVVMFPARDDMEHALEEKPVKYRPLLNDLARLNMHHIDVLDGFLELGGGRPVGAFFAGHYTPWANLLVAKHVHARLARQTGLFPTIVAVTRRSGAASGPSPDP